MPSTILNTLTHLTSTAGRPISAHLSKLPRTTPTTAQSSSSHRPRTFRPFSSTSPIQNWLLPRKNEAKKSRKGRPRVPTGGSARGTTLIHGTYGIRLLDHHRRISAAQLKNGETVIRQRLKGMKYRLYTRICANIGVYTSGNEVRMGKGKGRFDYWAARVAVSKVIFEIEGGVHEKVAREAVRLAGNKLPGLYEFVKKGDPPVVGITKLTDGVTLETLKRPRREVPLPMKGEENSSTVDGFSENFAGLALGSSAVASDA